MRFLATITQKRKKRYEKEIKINAMADGLGIMRNCHVMLRR